MLSVIGLKRKPTGYSRCHTICEFDRDYLYLYLHIVLSHIYGAELPA